VEVCDSSEEELDDLRMLSAGGGERFRGFSNMVGGG